MLSLADRVLATLPSFTEPPLARDVALRLNTDEKHVRLALERLESEGRARLVRRGNGLYLVPADYPGRICPVCRAEVTSKAKHVRCCSKVCSSKFMWQTRDRSAQGEVMRRSRVKGLDKMLANNVASHRTPEYRARHSERNRKEWTDPVMRMKRVVGMEAAWQRPDAEERKAKIRAKKKSLWADPDWVERTLTAMRTGKRGQYKRAAMRLVSEGASDEEIAARTGRTLEQTRQLLRRLFKDGLIARAPVDGRKNRGARS